MNDREIAEAATPGPWEHGIDEEDNGIEAVRSDGVSRGCVCILRPYNSIRAIRKYGEGFSHDDARYIAHFDPVKVLDMIDHSEAQDTEIKQLRARIEELEKKATFNRRCRDCVHCVQRSIYNCPNDADAETCFVPLSRPEDKGSDQ